MPPPAVILSPPTPPITVFVPLVRVMSSASPDAKSELVTLSSTPALLKVTVPLSPTTVALAPAAVPFTEIVSASAPPTTTFRPEPIVIVSIPPTLAFVELITVVPVAMPLLSVKTSKRPSSPRMVLVPSPTLIASAPAPAITVFTPPASVTVSLPPFPRLIDSISRKLPSLKN